MKLKNTISSINKKNVTIEFTSNGIVLLNNKKLSIYKSTSIKDYKITNMKTFIKELISILQKNNIKYQETKYHISLIISSIYKEIDRMNLKYIFKNLCFNNIEFITMNNILNLSKDELAIDISENNLTIYNEQNVYYSRIYFSKYKEILNIYLKEILSTSKIRTIKLFGNLESLNELADYISLKYKRKTFIYSQPSTIPINLLT